MAYIEANLEPGERIVCKARVHRIAYVYPIILLLGAMAFRGVTRLASTELALTDKRVIGKVGMGKRMDLAYSAVESVRVKRGLLGMLFDYGDIIITGNDGRKTKFRGICEPLDLQIQIDEGIEMAVLGRKLSQTVMEKF